MSKSEMSAATFKSSTALCNTYNINTYRNVCIIYGTTKPELGAILCDCNRRQLFGISDNSYNSKYNNCVNLGGCFVTTTRINQDLEKPKGSQKLLVTCSSEEQSGICYWDCIANCIYSWKLMLLNPYYTEDEEDVYVSENEILKLKQTGTGNVPAVRLQRLKSVSIDNLLRIPQDKTSLSERFRNKLQKSVLKLNRSPRDKQGKLSSKRLDPTSLFFKNDVKSKHKIFGATLLDIEKDEIHEDVPKFVVDCIEFIENKDWIQIEGLYRASGNKNAIDDMKNKLNKSYIYNSELLRNQDVHTVTGLLKLFFRELETPLIPSDIYRLLKNLSDNSSIPVIKRILQNIPQISKATLKYLLKHLQNVSHHSSQNRMPASNLAIIWGPCILFTVSANPAEINRMNTLMKILIQNYDVIFTESERLVN